MNDEAKKQTNHPRDPSVDRGERPDLGRTPDHLAETLDQALTGTNGGSDTRAGSLRGGSASGSDIDPDQETIDKMLTSEGMASADRKTEDAPGDIVRNTGRNRAGPGDDADAATG